ncbi:MAG: hypothetical protein S4CHLAM45_13950 [Chlamydiales bacterium]|nr:hypothetical protein [Chlamydiales bacterium]MCH9620500.1 hypothetical protein [Chlamydiales bacterium]MCH9623485.1 hypothetical protein [Chlamydiales bacterium]
MEFLESEHLWMTLTIALILCFFVNYFAFRLGFYRLPEKSVSLPVGFKHLVGAFGTYLVVTLIFYPLMLLFVGKVPGMRLKLSNGLSGWLQLFYMLTLFITLYGYLFALKRDVIRAIFFDGALNRTKTFFRGILIGVSAWLVSYPAVLVVNLVTGWIGMKVWGENDLDQVAVAHLKALADQPLLYWLMVIVIILLVPMIEELLFRGFLQSWLRRFLGRWGALFATAVIFAVVHFSPKQGVANFELICSLFVLSCFLGFVYERQKTLWASVALHSTFNGMTVIFLTLQ